MYLAYIATMHCNVLKHHRAWVRNTWNPGCWGGSEDKKRSNLHLGSVGHHFLASGTIFRELAPPSIGLDPIKPCTLIFPMGFGALIQIGWINTVHIQRVANTCRKNLVKMLRTMIMILRNDCVAFPPPPWQMTFLDGQSGPGLREGGWVVHG